MFSPSYSPLMQMSKKNPTTPRHLDSWERSDAEGLSGKLVVNSYWRWVGNRVTDARAISRSQTPSNTSRVVKMQRQSRGRESNLQRFLREIMAQSSHQAIPSTIFASAIQTCVSEPPDVGCESPAKQDWLTLLFICFCIPTKSNTTRRRTVKDIWMYW